MTKYKILNVRPESKVEYDKTRIDYQHRTGKKIDGLDFFDTIIKKFKEVVLDDNKKNL